MLLVDHTSLASALPALLPLPVCPLYFTLLSTNEIPFPLQTRAPSLDPSLDLAPPPLPPVVPVLQEPQLPLRARLPVVPGSTPLASRLESPLLFSEPPLACSE
jgi:hypothetical protein